MQSQVITINNMIRIPGGEFKMRGINMGRAFREGDPKKNRTQKVWVEVSPFSIRQYSVTRGEILGFIEETGRVLTEHQLKVGVLNFLKKPLSLDKPAVHLTNEDMIAFCDWIAKRENKPIRLPTEAEWLWAFGGEKGKTELRMFPWGNEWSDKNVPARTDNHFHRQPDLVMAHPQGASYWGVEGFGNVLELTLDYFWRDYPKEFSAASNPCRNTACDPLQYRVTKGLSFYMNPIDPNKPSGGSDDLLRGGILPDEAVSIFPRYGKAADDSLGMDIGFRYVEAETNLSSFPRKSAIMPQIRRKLGG
ncbi:MAG: SUMF1/EgtB/PvdO family nonheme iron enzyme [Candidatus Margulisiibacteriota bacterium]